MVKSGFIDVLDFAPEKIYSSKNDGAKYSLRLKSDDTYLYLAYSVPTLNGASWEGFREFTALLPRYIKALAIQNPSWPAWKIAEITGVSAIKVNRVRKAMGPKPF
jgi:hypothetical protein